MSCPALKKKREYKDDKKVQMPAALLEIDETLWLLDFSGFSENNLNFAWNIFSRKRFHPILITIHPTAKLP